MALPSPINLFDESHYRAEQFLGLREKGRKVDDELRAAVIFAVTAIDVYFHTKIIKYFREKQQKSTEFDLPEATRELLKEVISKELTGSNFTDLPKKKKELIESACVKSNSSLISYLETSLKNRSFQSIGSINDAMEIMGKKPQEVWGKFDSSTRNKQSGSKKIKPGNKIDAKVQLKRLFDRRHLIIHEADMPLRGKTAGKVRGIHSKTVKNWLTHSKKAVQEIDKLI